MTHQSSSTVNQPQKSRFGLEPPLAWSAIIGFILFSALLTIAGAGSLVNLVFPAGALLVAFLLYIKAPILYVGFTWWLWFLAPLVRRLADYQSGFTDPSPILLAPLLASLVAGITVVKYFSYCLRQSANLPFFISLSALIYGFLVALIYRSSFVATLALIEWTAPVLFSFHLFINWRDYPQYRQNLWRVMVWSVLIMGAYGIFQYLTAPAWDTYWLANAPIASAGKPVPLGIRVWSTLNSPRPFGTVMAASLLVLLTSKAKLSIPATVVGYISLLLSLSRTAWGSWIIGLVILGNSLKAKFQIRLIATLLAIAVLVIPLLTVEPFAERIGERLETFTELEEDNSAKARQKTYDELLDSALLSFFGKGLGGPTHDSAILSMLFDLGWLGASFYFGGILLIFVTLWLKYQSSSDIFLVAARAVVTAILAQIPLGGPTNGVQGTVLWGFMGIAMAGTIYHQYNLHQAKVNTANKPIEPK